MFPIMRLFNRVLEKLRDLGLRLFQGVLVLGVPE